MCVLECASVNCDCHSEEYKNYLRMSDENVRYLTAKVKPLIAKQNTVMRNAVTPEARIAATVTVTVHASTHQHTHTSEVFSTLHVYNQKHNNSTRRHTYNT
jgi:hypothetical protein